MLTAISCRPIFCIPAPLCVRSWVRRPRHLDTFFHIPDECTVTDLQAPATFLGYLQIISWYTRLALQLASFLAVVLQISLF